MGAQRRSREVSEEEMLLPFFGASLQCSSLVNIISSLGGAGAGLQELRLRCRSCLQGFIVYGTWWASTRRGRTTLSADSSKCYLSHKGHVLLSNSFHIMGHILLISFISSH